MLDVRRKAALVLAAVVASVAGACGTQESPSTSAQGPGDGGGAHPDAGGAPGSDPPPIEVDPEVACPAAFTAPGSGPKQGTNTGFSVGGQDRTFQLLLPPGSFTGPRPILFAFHGTSETGQRFITRAKLQNFADKGFIVVAPDAVGNGVFWPVWDAMRAPGTESAQNLDVLLFDQLLACTAAHHAVDKTRVFVTGHSAGGIFTNRLLRSRSNVLAGGIVGSGVFDFTASGTKAALDPMFVIVTWGGDNDSYSGTTPTGVSVPAFSFVEQASLASKHYAAEGNVAHARCRGTNLGHAWLPINDWFIDLLLSRPKGSAAAALPALPAGAPAACSTDPYELAPLADVTCGSSTRAGCREACQLFADCAVENRTIRVSLQNELGDIGFTPTSCSGCVQSCQTGASTAQDMAALSCFTTKQAAASCGPGIEGAIPLFAAINECCAGRSGSNLCMNLCSTLNGNPAARAFLPTCTSLVQ